MTSAPRQGTQREQTAIMDGQTEYVEVASSLTREIFCPSRDVTLPAHFLSIKDESKVG